MSTTRAERIDDSWKERSCDLHKLADRFDTLVLEVLEARNPEVAAFLNAALLIQRKHECFMREVAVAQLTLLAQIADK